VSLRLGSQSQRGEHNSGEADAEFLQRPAARDGLGHSFGQFIEFTAHNFPFVWFVWFPGSSLLQRAKVEKTFKDSDFTN
jgi:hypothetical protein